MEVKISKEGSVHVEKVFELIQHAFEHEKYSDHKEQFLVEKLRASDAFIPELSLVAEVNHQVVGYILLTRIKIKNGKEEWASLAMAPVAVQPRWQRKGIGGLLIREAHRKAKELGYESIVVLGHEDYYPRFGYHPAGDYGIEIPFDVPAENCMLIELNENALNGITGTVEYAKEFYE